MNISKKNIFNLLVYDVSVVGGSWSDLFNFEANKSL